LKKKTKKVKKKKTKFCIGPTSLNMYSMQACRHSR
jgi:hypothetical protein